MIAESEWADLSVLQQLTENKERSWQKKVFIG
jgi:hypothetical protein